MALSQVGKGRIFIPLSKSFVPSRETEKFMFLDLRGGKKLEPSWQTLSASHGELSTRNIGECPNHAVESTLSSVLENMGGGGIKSTLLLQKYSLTPKACQGILRRAHSKGRKLHPILKRMLTEIAEGRGPFIDISDLLSGKEECVISVENYPTDGRMKIRPDGSVQTLVAGMGTGGAERQ